MYLNSNHLTFIPANAFKKLSTIETASIEIELEDNLISSINDNAFSGIENKLSSLNLASNNLMYLPRALTKLASLQHLNLLHNSFVDINESVITHLSSFIEVFKISIG